MKPRILLISLLISLYSVLSLNASYESLVTDESYSTYHGWLKYLHYLKEDSAQRYGSTNTQAIEAQSRLDQWVSQIEQSADTIETLSGVFEWAYLSEVDDSGQPFTLSVPENYDPEKSYELLISMHGYGGAHYRREDWLTNRDDRIAVAVLGRAYGGIYQNLSEIDVLDVINYVQKHWSIDPRRIHVTGSSMGGRGSFYLANRFPHMFASARPICGAGINQAVENWKHIAFYSYHSIDDSVVPVTGSRIPLKTLQSIHDNVIIHETDGYNHALGGFIREIDDPSETWYQQFRSPDSKDVLDIDFTAYDGKATKAYWAEITKWGSRFTPARFRLDFDKASERLAVNTTNIDILKIDLSTSPIRTGQSIHLEVNGQSMGLIEIPEGNEMFLHLQNNTARVAFEEPNEPEIPWHFPGGPENLYDGKPLLIVWGTRGNSAENMRLESAARELRSSPHPYIPFDLRTNDDGFRKAYNRFGMLKGKPDDEVTDEDFENYHIVLLGSSRLNSVAQMLSSSLPVQISSNQVSCNDGIRWRANEPVVFFTHYNPIAPQNLIFWISCDDSQFYSSATYMLEMDYPRETGMGGKDLVIKDLNTHSMVAKRCFNSDWAWEAGYRQSPMITQNDLSFPGIARLKGQIARNAVNADFSLNSWLAYGIPNRVTRNQTRMMDLHPDSYGVMIAIAEVTGSELLSMNQVCESVQDGYSRYEIDGNIRLSQVNATQNYSICMDLGVFTRLIGRGILIPESLRYTGVTMHDAFDADQNN